MNKRTLFVVCGALGITAILFVFFIRLSSSTEIKLSTAIPLMGESFDMRIEKWDPPLYLSNGSTFDSRAPKWLRDCALIYEQGVTYENFISRVSREYIEYYKVDKAAFDRMRAAVASQPPLKTTVFWALHLKIQGENYILVARQVGENVPFPPADKQYIGATVLRQGDNGWELYPYDSTSALALIPFNDLKSLENIMSVKSVKLGKYDQLIPAK